MFRPFRPLLGWCATGVAAIAVFGTLAHIEKYELRSELESFLTEPTASASLSDMRLYRYHVAHRLDPIFSLEGTNPDDLRKTAHRLNAFQNESLGVFSSEERELIATFTPPLSYWDRITEMEEARLAFIDDPIRVNAVRYHRALVHALDVYLSWSEEVERTMRSHSGGTSGVHTLTGYTDIQFAADEIAKSQDTVRALKSKERQRFGCMFGLGFNCDDFRLPVVAEPPPIDTRLPPKAALYHSILRAYLRSEGGRTAVSRGTSSYDAMPLIAHEDSACVPNPETSAPLFFLFWATTRLSDTQGARLTTAHDIFFIDTQSAHVGQYTQAFRDIGIRYQYQMLNPYLCLDYSRDLGAMITAYVIRSQLAEKPVFSDMETPDQLHHDLKALERAIVKSPTLSTSAVTEYMRLIRELLTTRSERALANMAGETSIYELERLLRIYGAQSAWYDTVLGAIEDSLVSLTDIRTLEPIPTTYLILARSHAYTLLFLHNPSLTGAPVSFLRVREDHELDGFSILSYTSYLSKYIPPAMLERYLRDVQVRGDPLFR